MKFSSTSFWGLDVPVRAPLSVKIQKGGGEKGGGSRQTLTGVTEPLYST